jgi:glycosyltransferase involved in cell wall biosynthesis
MICRYTILMIAPTPFFADRGCHVQIYEQARSLQKLGHSVTICTYHNGRDIPGIVTKRIIKIPWYNKLEAGPSPHKIYLDMLLFFESLVTAIRLRPYVIHGHLHEGAFIGYFVSKLTNTPLLFDLQGSLTGEMRAHKFMKNNSLLDKFIYFMEKKIDNMADVVVTQSTDMVEELKNKFKVPTNKVFLTLDGVNTEDFRPDLDFSDLWVKLCLPNDKKIVVYLGLLNEYQGVDCLLEAIPFVLKKRQDVHFLIMGYPDVEKYQKMAKRLGVIKNITFTGRIDYKEAPRYLLIGDIAVSPKLSETEANGKLYNYMACGLPTVAFDTPVNREIIGELGVYAQKIGDPSSLAEAILRILEDDVLMAELSVKVRQSVVENFSWDNVARKLISYYQRAAMMHG